jgi:transposase
MRKEPVMKKLIRFVGLDVHAETIAVAVAEPDGTVRSLGRIANRPEAVRKLLKGLGAADSLRVCYEAGPCGYVLYWQLTKLGVHCEVIAPTLIPTKAGDRVKTDRRDAEKLARCYRSGDLTPVWVPDAEHEALRDLVRAREAAKKDQLRARHRLGKFLLRHGLRPTPGVKAWSCKYRLWLQSLRFEHKALEATFLDYRAEVEHAGGRIDRLEESLDAAIETAPAETRAIIDALQALRGIKKLTATTIVVEVGRLSRFAHPRQLMGYSGLVPSEHSSGGPDHTRRGGITKTGNAHLRRVLVEAAWTYQHRPALYPALRRRQQGLSDEVREIAWKAQHRLHSRYARLSARGKVRPQVITAVARELLGFIWSIGIHTEQACAARPKRLAA